VPQLDVNVDRLKAKTQGVALSDLFEDLAGLSRLDLRQRFQSFGRAWRVYAQAEATTAKRSRTLPT